MRCASCAGLDVRRKDRARLTAYLWAVVLILCGDGDQLEEIPCRFIALVLGEGRFCRLSNVSLIGLDCLEQVEELCSPCRGGGLDVRLHDYGVGGRSVTHSAGREGGLEGGFFEFSRPELRSTLKTECDVTEPA